MTTTTTTVTPTAASPTPAPLKGTQAVDISWSDRPEPGVACANGLHGYCTHVMGSGTSNKLGVVSLDEYLATPKDGSCSTATVAGTVTMTDTQSSAVTYTGHGNFCWRTISGVIHLKLGKGTGELRGATGALVAKIKNGSTLTDDWTGTVHLKA